MNELRLRRHAMEIVSNLPEDPKEAMRVLSLARTLIESF